MTAEQTNPADVPPRPLDYRIYDRARDGMTKNDHFRDLLERAYARGFEPESVLFDTWYASLENLKAVRAYGWSWVTRFKADRHLNPDGQGNRAVETCEIAADGTHSPRMDTPSKTACCSTSLRWGGTTSR